MQFSSASAVEQTVWGMKLADWPRAQNRALINDLFNGSPPYSAQEERANNIEINVNFLESTRLGHDARQQYVNAFVKPGVFFNCKTDAGPKHKRDMNGSIVTKDINRIMKRSMHYMDCNLSKFASQVLHGIGPSGWMMQDKWCPDPYGIEDVLVPSTTLRSLRNLEYFAVFRAYTVHELMRLTNGSKVDPAWNMDAVNAAIEWAETEVERGGYGTTWPEVWSPEKMAERRKEDGGLYASDAVPTIDCWDFYYWDDSEKKEGWRRRIIFDAFGSMGAGGVNAKPILNKKSKVGTENTFLYNPGDRVYADKLCKMIQFQFADLSAVAPFRYHSVRSLGFLLFAVCHLQNRLRCKFQEAVFEGLMMYMRVRSLDEAERALKINLINRGIVDETVQFLSPAERWQVNEALAQLGLQHNERIIAENASGYAQNRDFNRPTNVEKTKFQVMAELNATTSLISAALNQAYEYQRFEYLEIFRRFCQKNSKDSDIRDFRLRCLKQGVPEEVLVPEAWDLEPDRVLSPNKSMEQAIAGQLMEWRNLYPPESQTTILKKATLAVTDDPGLSEALLPDHPEQISASRHMGQMDAGVLLQGLPVMPGKDINRIEYVEALLAAMAIKVQQIEQTGGMPESMTDIIGLQNIAQAIASHIQFIALDKNEKQRVREYSDALGQLMNMVKAFAQRWQEQQQQGNGQPDPEAMAKIQSMQMQAQAKAANTRESHAQRTAQRQVAFEQKQRQDAEAHALEQRKKIAELETNVAATDIATAAEIQQSRAKAATKPQAE
jgi:hypothetical protein